MRDDAPGQLREPQQASDADPVGEPLATVVRTAVDALGWKQADVARVTKLSPQLVSQIIHRRRRYVRPPDPETLEALALIPGLRRLDIMWAVANSIGLNLPTVEDEPQTSEYSGSRRALRAVVDDLPEQDVSRALQILLALRH